MLKIVVGTNHESKRGGEAFERLIYNYSISMRFVYINIIKR